MNERSCDKCKHKQKFIQETQPTIFLNICLAEDFEEHEEGYYIAPEISDFDASSCNLFMLKEELR
jgi:hypothetical protein